MKISIITVARNSAATIGYTLDSIASQSHADIEHIVIDGASTDDTVQIVEARGTRVAKLVSEPDAGIYDAMNKGLALATGDFVGFLNADDAYSDASVVSEIARAAMAGGADAVYGDLVYVDRHHTDRVIRHWRSGMFTRGSLRFGWMPPHPTLYLRRKLVEERGGFDVRLEIAADYDFVLRYFLIPDIQVAYIRRVLVNMRTGGVSNRSLSALLTKAREDLGVLERHRVGGWPTLVGKIARKLPQFISRPARRD